MIDPKNRLCKLLRACRTFQEFKAEAVRRSSWVLAPYVKEGHQVTGLWIEAFWKSRRTEAV